jgi:hypothetical protein
VKPLRMLLSIMGALIVSTVAWAFSVHFMALKVHLTDQNVAPVMYSLFLWMAFVFCGTAMGIYRLIR